MSINSHNTQDENILEIDQQTQQQLRSAASWAKIIAIPTIIVLSLAIFALIVINLKTGNGFGTTVISIAVIGVYIKIWHYLYKFGQETEESLEDQNSESMSTAFFYLQKYFYWTLTLFCIALVLVIGLLLFAALLV